ncbi:MAG: hypothetical protein M3O70_24200 [Actinomycetota bacterium]|nr:hypothetical protein [Actinomycetota bacterium]
MVAPIGTFADHHADFAALLWHLAHGPPHDNTSFVARNFLLDERVPAGRADSYLSPGVPSTWYEWTRLHRVYEVERLHVAPPSGLLPLPSKAVERQNLPETFEQPPTGDQYSQTSPELHLLRVESVARLAEVVDLDPFDLAERLGQYATAGNPGPSEQLWLLSILDAYASRQQLRPIFAAFVEDVREVMEASASISSTLAQLRDRLGLSHYDPADTGPLPLAVFRYPVDVLPRVDGIAGVVLVSPTVLESGQSAAFCPCPRGTQFGTAVDLSPASRWPAREALHLPFRYGPNHLFLAGILEDPVTGTLAAWRERHLRALQRLGATEYATGTDADILGLVGEP